MILSNPFKEQVSVNREFVLQRKTLNFTFRCAILYWSGLQESSLDSDSFCTTIPLLIVPCSAALIGESRCGKHQPSSLITWSRLGRIFFISYITTPLKRRTLRDVPKIKKVLTQAQLHAGPLDVSGECFVKHSETYKRLVAVEGDYFKRR